MLELVDNMEKHPGLQIKKLLGNINQKEFAKKLGVSPPAVSLLLCGQRNVTAEMAVRLEKVTGIQAKRWLYLQVEYDIEKARHKLS